MRRFFTLTALAAVLATGMQLPANAQAAPGALRQQLEQTYQQWRNAMMSKDSRRWQAYTSQRRQTTVRNQIYSERRAFPSALFQLPVAPPNTRGLKALRAQAKGATAKAVYFGKIDFGVGGKPTDNLLVLNFVLERGAWKYDGAEFVNLSALPDVRKQLLAGQNTFVTTAEFGPSGRVGPTPIPLRGPVKYIAKTYVYCPGREVNLQINKISRHRFQNTKAAEVVIGGAKDGLNEVQFSVKRLPGSEGTEPMAIRIYLMSEVQGVKPIKAFEYEVKEKQVPKGSGTSRFNVDPKIVQKLMGR